MAFDVDPIPEKEKEERVVSLRELEVILNEELPGGWLERERKHRLRGAIMKEAYLSSFRCEPEKKRRTITITSVTVVPMLDPSKARVWP